MANDFILQENGDYILQEDGDKIITEQRFDSITAKAAIQIARTKSVTAKSFIRIRYFKTILSIGNVKSVITRTVSAVAAISGRRISAKANIKTVDVSRQILSNSLIKKEATVSISSKATLYVNRQQSIESKGYIFRTGIIGKPSFGVVSLPFPDYADISPEWEYAENMVLSGKTRRNVMARKYQYKFKWNTMKVEYYDNLEAVTNSLEASQFVYGKWPQSREGVICLGSLSPRKLTYKDGDSVYLSSVILILIEVESRI